MRLSAQLPKEKKRNKAIRWLVNSLRPLGIGQAEEDSRVVYKERPETFPMYDKNCLKALPHGLENFSRSSRANPLEIRDEKSLFFVP